MKYLSVILFLISIVCNLIGLGKSKHYLSTGDGSSIVLRWLACALILYIAAIMMITLG
nr:MAG TPA: hypothetical protein [Caudoviricetes sp.]